MSSQFIFNESYINTLWNCFPDFSPSLLLQRVASYAGGGGQGEQLKGNMLMRICVLYKISSNETIPISKGKKKSHGHHSNGTRKLRETVVGRYN
jgi:hypothetical protein